MSDDVFKEISSDIETLGTKSNSIILSIGLVKFNSEDKDAIDDIDESRCYYANLDIISQINAGGRMTPETVAWWLTNNYERVPDLQTDRKSVELVLHEIKHFLKDNKYLIWGNGSGFDCNLMRDLYDNFNIEFPANFYMDRDLRTRKCDSGLDKPKMERVAHNALSDAKYQAVCAQYYLLGEDDSE